MPGFYLSQTNSIIDRLFHELWPRMAGVGERRADCRRQAQDICNIINQEQTHDAQLIRLIGLSGIRATIGSGLLWSFFPHECVPFDKHTMGYCLADWRILKDNKITNGTYAQKCNLICNNLQAHNSSLVSIEDLVRFADENRSYELGPE